MTPPDTLPKTPPNTLPRKNESMEQDVKEKGRLDGLTMKNWVECQVECQVESKVESQGMTPPTESPLFTGVLNNWAEC